MVVGVVEMERLEETEEHMVVEAEEVVVEEMEEMEEYMVVEVDL